MTLLPLQREAIEPRLDGIQKELLLLRDLGDLTLKEFLEPINFDRAQLHLRFALEGVFHISSHLLSRIPGGRYTEYKELARKLGEVGIVSKEFATNKLVPMAGYRNRLTHFYAEIKSEELYKILRKDLDDIEEFLRAVKRVLKNPEKFGLKIE